MSETTAPVTAWLDDARDTIADVIPHPDETYEVYGRIYDVAETLLAGVETALRIHSPRREHWCEECTTLHPCTTRREIIAALLGEASDD